MIIANPLYDTAFKSLISDHEVAKAVIGALLETEVLELDVRPTEHVKPQADDKSPHTIRLDFCVKIKNEIGEHQKVLIEIQKRPAPESYTDFENISHWQAIVQNRLKNRNCQS